MPVRFDNERLAAAITDGEHAPGWVLEHGAALAALLDLRDARAEIAHLNEVADGGIMWAQNAEHFRLECERLKTECYQAREDWRVASVERDELSAEIARFKEAP